MANRKITTTSSYKSDGSIKKLQKEADSLGKSMGSVARNVKDSDRRLKGASQQSSNSTKNFSKMAQTMEGGIVPLYATLAAQVFAVTAAFQFFKNSVDFRNLIEGQKAFGSVTGIAFRTFTKDIQAATEGQLNFKEAAQATAIGVAAGLSRQQLIGIGEAAKNSSLALGRDLTDAFNRLTRGITKAEPELLDELGIILRLDPALRAYADEIGKTKEQLNQFEKSQAVANEVLGQADRKFGRITEIMDPSAFAMSQFAVAFGEVVQSLQIGLSKFLLPVLTILKENVLALGGALALFTKPILQSVLPDFEAMGASAERNSLRATMALRRLQGQSQLEKFKGDQVGGRQAAAKSISEMNRKIGRDKFSGASKLAGGTGQMSQAMINAERRALGKSGELRRAFNMEERRQYRMHLKLMEQSLTVSKAKQNNMEVQQTNFFKLQNARRLAIQARFDKMRIEAARLTSVAMTRAMSLVGGLGALFLVVGVIQQLVGMLKGELPKAQQDFNDKLKRSVDGAKSLAGELERMRQVQAEGLVAAGTDTTTQFANMIKSSGGVQTTFSERQKTLTDAKVFGRDTSFQGPDVELVGRLTENLANQQARLLSAQKALANDPSSEYFKTQVKAIENSIAAKEEQIDANNRVRFADEELNDMNQSLISTYDSLASGTGFTALKQGYKDIAQALREGKEPSKEQLDSLSDLESKYTDMSDRVEKSGEVIKTFNNQLTRMAGKGRAYSGMRKALVEMLKTQQAIIDSQVEGGAEAAKEDVEKMARLNAFNEALQTQVKLRETLDIAAQKVAQQAAIQKRAIGDEEKLALINTNNAKAAIKHATAVADQKDAELAIQALEEQGRDATSEDMKDAQVALDIAKEKVTTAAEELHTQVVLTDLEAAKLKLSIANTKNAKEKLALDNKLLDLEKEQVFAQGMAGNTGFGSRMKKQFALDQSRVKLKKMEEDLLTRIEQKENRQAEMGPAAIALDEEKTRNLEKQIALLEEQNAFAEFALTTQAELQMTFAKGIEDMFVSIATGAKNAKEAFKDMALFMLKKMAEMAAQQLAFSALSSIGFPFISAAKGGIYPMAKGGIIPGYAFGGIATEPTFLVGEGKHNEAVVPLPDGRTIPVTMSGQSGTNNITINVDANGGSTSTVDGDNALALAKMVEASVMETIHREKRPGGVLN